MDHHGDHQGNSAGEDHIPRDDSKAKQQGEENRKELDAVPEHGTDPLHEGP